MKTYRSIFDLPPSRLPRGLIGGPLIPMLPKRSRAVWERPFSGEWGLLGRLIRNGHYLRAIARKDHAVIQRFLRDYWTSSASQGFFDGFEHRFESVFLRHHAGIIDEIAKVVKRWPGTDQRLVEIGVGDARVLRHLASELEGFADFHGIDVNEEQILAQLSRDPPRGGISVLLEAGSSDPGR